MKKTFLYLVLALMIIGSASAEDYVLGYVTADGGSGTEDSYFVDLVTNNSIQNFTIVSIGTDWSNLSLYDDLVDVYYLGNKFNSLTGSNVDDLKSTTKGMVVAEEQHAADLEFCGGVDNFAGTDANIIDNTLPIYNSTNGISSTGSLTMYSSFKDFRACSSVNTNITDVAQRNGGSTEYSGLVVENGTILDTWTTNARWVVAIVADDQAEHFESISEDITIHELLWIIDGQENTTEEPPTPPSYGLESHYLNYTGVQDRSSCMATTLNSDSVCFRTDTTSLIGNDSFRMVDIYNRDTDFTTHTSQNSAALHYLGSQFYGNDRPSVLPQLGIADIYNAQTSGTDDIYSLATFPCRDIRITNYEWRPDMIQTTCENRAGDGPMITSEARMSAVSKYAYTVEATFKCTDPTGCDTSGNQLYLKHQISGNADPYSLTYSADVGGTGYAGLISSNFDTATNWMDENANYTFYIIPSTTPDDYAINTRTAYLYWDLAYNEELQLNVSITALPDASNAVNYMENPAYYTDKHTEVITDWFNNFKVPNSTSARMSDYNMTRAIHHSIWGFYHSTVNQYGDRSSYFNVSGTENCYMSAAAGYKGHWKWDGFFEAWGMAAACKETPECYSLVQDSFTCLWEYQNNVTGEVPQNARDTWIEPDGSTYQANGGWDMVIRWLCNGRVTDTDWCQNAYDQLKLEHDWFRSNNDDDSDNLFDWPSGPAGWDDSRRFRIGTSTTPINVEAVDLQGWTIIQAESIANLSYTYNTSDTATYTQYVNDYRNAAQGLWSSSLGNFYDNIPSTDVPITDADGERLTGAISWAIFANFSTPSQTAIIYDEWQDPTTLGPSALGYGAIPSLARNHDCFVDGETSQNPLCVSGNSGKWNGRNWAPIWAVAYLGAKRDGNQTMQDYVRDTAFKSYYGHGITQESWDSTDGSNPENGDFAGENFAGFGDGVFAVIEYDWNPSFAAEEYEDTVAPTLSNFRSQPSYTQVNLLWSASEPVNCSLEYGPTVGMGITVTRPTFGSGCSFSVTGLDENTTYYWQGTSWDSSGNSAQGSVLSFDTNVQYDLDWEEKFNEVTDFYRNRRCFLHWDLHSQLYDDTTRCVESYINMYVATGDETYLTDGYVILDNLTARWGTDDWNLISTDFQEGHLAGILAKYSYYAKDANPTVQAKAAAYRTFLEDTLLPRVDTNYAEETINGVTMGTLQNSGGTYANPLNQQSGYIQANLFMYGITGEADYYRRAAAMVETYKASVTNYACHYDETKTCFTTPYRSTYGFSWEGSGSGLWGVPPHNDELHYGSQMLEMYYQLWKYGLLDNDFMESIANTLYYNMYVQEGGLNNVLIGRSWGYPTLTSSDYHHLYETHHATEFGYYKIWVPELGEVAGQVRNDTFSYVDDGDGTFSFFDPSNPYESVVDPRNNEAGTYSTEYNEITPDIMLKHISVNLLSDAQLNERTIFADPDVEGFEETPKMSWETLFQYLYGKTVKHVFGNQLLFGLWMVVIIIGAAVGLGLDLSVGLLVVIPATIGFMALGMIPTAAGAAVIIFAAFVLAFSWWQSR